MQFNDELKGNFAGLHFPSRHNYSYNFMHVQCMQNSKLTHWHERSKFLTFP